MMLGRYALPLLEVDHRSPIIGKSGPQAIERKSSFSTVNKPRKMDARLLALDDDELDEQDREDVDLQDGPYSSQIEMTMGNVRFQAGAIVSHCVMMVKCNSPGLTRMRAANIPEDDELALLRKENALLQRKVKELEKATHKDKTGA